MFCFSKEAVSLHSLGGTVFGVSPLEEGGGQAAGLRKPFQKAGRQEIARVGWGWVGETEGGWGWGCRRPEPPKVSVGFCLS